MMNDNITYLISIYSDYLLSYDFSFDIVCLMPRDTFVELWVKPLLHHFLNQLYLAG